MKLWEQRSYPHAIKAEQERLVHQAHLHSRYGRAWRRTAPVEALIPLRLARHGIPLTHTAPAGLAAAGIEPMLLPAAPQTTAPHYSRAAVAAPAARWPEHLDHLPEQPGQAMHNGLHPPGGPADMPETSQETHAPHPQQAGYDGGCEPPLKSQQCAGRDEHPRLKRYGQRSALGQSPPEEIGDPPVPVSPGRTRSPGEGRLPKRAQDAQALHRQQETRDVSGARQPPDNSPNSPPPTATISPG